MSETLGITFTDPALAEIALTHRSYAFEQGDIQTNERLEFLGDAVLGLVVADLAYRENPDLPEGELAKLRAAVVSMDALAEIARELDLGSLVRLGRGEQMSNGRNKSSILSDALEAVLGAVYLDQGMDAAAGLIDRLFSPRMQLWISGQGGRDHKTELQEAAARLFGTLPSYRITERGPDHMKEFTATVELDGRAWGTGSGSSKKEAEQGAAAETLPMLPNGGAINGAA